MCVLIQMIVSCKNTICSNRECQRHMFPFFLFYFPFFFLINLRYACTTVEEPLQTPVLCGHRKLVNVLCCQSASPSQKLPLIRQYGSQFEVNRCHLFIAPARGGCSDPQEPGTALHHCLSCHDMSHNRSNVNRAWSETTCPGTRST